MKAKRPRKPMIGILLRKWRHMSELGLNEGARQIGLSTPTLSRIERGNPMDAKTMLKIIAWLFGETLTKR